MDEYSSFFEGCMYPDQAIKRIENLVIQLEEDLKNVKNIHTKKCLEREINISKNTAIDIKQYYNL